MIWSPRTWILKVTEQLDMFPDQATADFSPCRTWRYSLTRTWDPNVPPLVWLMCNPSIADENKLDPTLRRVRGFSIREGAGGFVVLNLFALVSTDPKGLKTHNDPIGDRNDEVIASLTKGKTVIAGWGRVGGVFVHRVQSVRRLLDGPLMCLGVTRKEKHPKHPLYLKKTDSLACLDKAQSTVSPVAAVESKP